MVVIERTVAPSVVILSLSREPSYGSRDHIVAFVPPAVANKYLSVSLRFTSLTKPPQHTMEAQFGFATTVTIYPLLISHTMSLPSSLPPRVHNNSSSWEKATASTAWSCSLNRNLRDLVA